MFFGFEVTVQDIYEVVHERYPIAVNKALTDDYTLALPPPDTDEDHQILWDKCSDILKFIAAESKAKANLQLNFSKCNILAPPGIKDPIPGTLPPGTSLKREGLRLAGAPIGKDSFCSNYIAEQVRNIKKKIDALEGIDPTNRMHATEKRYRTNFDVFYAGNPTTHHTTTPNQLR